MENNPLHLRGITFFDSLSDEDMYAVQQACQKQIYEIGEVIFREGSPGDNLFIVMEGSVEIWKDYESPDADLLSVYGPGQIFGELALIDEAPRSATVVARQDSTLLSMNRDDFELITQSNPISKSIMRSLSEMFRRRTDSFIKGLHIRNRKLEKAYSRMKSSESRLSAVLRDKGRFIQEIHKKIMANMQVINSMMGLQAALMQNTDAAAVFQESRNRIETLSLAHQSVLESGYGEDMEAAHYIRKIADHLLSIRGDNARGIRYEVSADGILLNLTDALPLGLIINELFTNALKYAFPDGSGGDIHISITKGDGRELIFGFSDTGAGLPDDMMPDDPRSFGLNMITGLAEKQLRGEISIVSGDRSEYIIRFTPSP